jgi:sugar O-acyltransferase (sialic acid O-acetyltransferase NeuD family)
MSGLPQGVVVYGAGGHAKSVLGVVVATGHHVVVGILDDDPATAGTTVLSYRVLGGIDFLPKVMDRDTMVHVAIGSNVAREAVIGRVQAAGYGLASIVHPAAFVMTGATVGEGVFIHHGAVIGCDAVVGDGAIVSAQVIVGHDCTLGRFVHLTPGVRLAGGVAVGDGVFMGMNAVVLPGVRIGSNASIAAGSVVTKDLPDGAVVAGMPARVVRMVEKGASHQE